MNSHPIRESFQKGIVFAAIMVFMMLTGFHMIAATMVSKIFGVYVLRGSIPEIRFMAYIHVLFGIGPGGQPAAKQEKHPPGL